MKIKTGEWDLKVFILNYWNGLALGSVQTYFLEVGAYVSLKRATTGLWEGWLSLKISHFLKYKNGGGDLKVLLFNYWNGLVLGEVETYFLEVIAYVSLKGVTTGVWEGRFCWIWLKISDFFKYKNGGEGSKSFIVWLLKWSCLGLCINISFGNRCMRVSGTSHCRLLRRSVLLNLTESITSF